jgi:hypothetical protein
MKDLGTNMTDLLNVARVVQHEVYAHYKVHSCIPAATIMAEVLTLLGMDGIYTLTVHARVYDPRFSTKVGMPSNGLKDWMTRMERVSKTTPHTIVVVGGGKAEDMPEGWAGHLITVVPKFDGEKAVFFDLTVMQADRPEAGIKLRPVVLKVNPKFLSAEEVAAISINGSLIIYKSFSDNHTYEDTALWQDKATHNDIVMRCLSVLI